MEFQLLKEVAIPVAAFGIGALLTPYESTAVPGKLAMFFGAQTVMNLYMKEVLSGTVLSEEEGLQGIPSAFLVTALQQLVAFLLFGVFLVASQSTPFKYTPKRLTSPTEWMAVLLFSLSFTMNIALNNYSISLLPLSVNLIIRSCLPLATFLSQQVASKCTNQPIKDARPLEVALMVAGVLCAAVAVVAESHKGGHQGEEEKDTLVFGIIVCVASLFSGAVNLALAGVLGTSVSLNSLDTTVYMSVPAFLILLVPTLCYRHTSWPGHEDMTDWGILLKVLALKPSAIGLAAVSGVLALFYNVFQYGIVQSLSASYTAFAGNFNKAATIAIGLLVGLETLPPAAWGWVMALACLGNIGAFTAFNVVKMQDKAKEEPSSSRNSSVPVRATAEEDDCESSVEASSSSDSTSTTSSDEEAKIFNHKGRARALGM